MFPRNKRYILSAPNFLNFVLPAADDFHDAFCVARGYLWTSLLTTNPSEREHNCDRCRYDGGRSAAEAPWPFASICIDESHPTAAAPLLLADGTSPGAVKPLDTVFNGVGSSTSSAASVGDWPPRRLHLTHRASQHHHHAPLSRQKKSPTRLF